MLIKFDILLSQDSTKSSIIIGVDKIINTHHFFLKANTKWENENHKLILFQDYSGDAIEAAGVSFADENTFNLNYNYKLFGGLELAAMQNYYYSSNTKTLGNSELSDLNGLIGTRYNFSDLNNVEFLLGVSKYKQINIDSKGSKYILNYNIDDLDFEGYSFKSNLKSGYLSLDDNRKIIDLNLNSRINKFFENSDFFDMGMLYNHHSLDILNNFIDLNQQAIERRIENHYVIDFSGSYSMLEWLTGALKFNYDNSNIGRSFRKSILNNISSMIRKNQNQTTINTDIDFNANLGFTTQRLSINIRNWNEEYTFEKTSNDLTDDQLSIIRKEGAIGNNQQSVLRLLYKSNYQLSDADTLGLLYLKSITRYDTPSDDNNSDNDESANFIGFYYHHSINSRLSARINLDIFNSHKVYLKSQRSAENKWWYIYRLSPQIFYRSDNISFAPSFEVLANYTVFDYENKSINIKSYSYRNVSWRDSIDLKLYKSMSTYFQLNCRYSENSVLYWKDFSEKPQTSKSELFLKNLFVYSHKSSRIGLGYRIYRMTSKPIAKSGLPPELKSDNLIFGPEFSFNLNFFNRSFVNLSGWYEYRYNNNLKQNSVVNVFLQTAIYF